MQQPPKKTSIKEIVVTVSLIVINVIVFFYHSLNYNNLPGETSIAVYMMEHGANFYPRVTGGEYYRLFTCIFLHFDVPHLLTNMLSLFAVGSIIEKAFGKTKFLVIYLVSGIGASIFSDLYFMSEGIAAVCAGASGAVFGLAGALVCLAVFKQMERYGIDSRRVPFAVFLTVILNFTNKDGVIDVAAHVGGLIVGFVVSFVIVYINYRRRKQQKNKQ